MHTMQILEPSALHASAANIGLLAVRLVIGLLMAAHGAQKLFGWFGGSGLDGTAAAFEHIGFRPGRRFATMAGLTEVAGGLLVALGLLGPVGPALIVSVMIVAAVSVHWRNGLFAASNGIELNLMYTSGAIALALTGPGRYALDAALDVPWLSDVRIALIVLAAGAIGGFGNLAMRRPTVTPAAPSAQAQPSA